MAITLTPKLRKEYEDLFGSCTVKTGKVATVDGIRDKILGKLDRYEGIEKLTGVPGTSSPSSTTWKPR